MKEANDADLSFRRLLSPRNVFKQTDTDLDHEEKEESGSEDQVTNISEFAIDATDTNFAIRIVYDLREEEREGRQAHLDSTRTQTSRKVGFRSVTQNTMPEGRKIGSSRKGQEENLGILVSIRQRPFDYSKRITLARVNPKEVLHGRKRRRWRRRRRSEH